MPWAQSQPSDGFTKFLYLTRLPVKNPLVVILNLIQDLEKAPPV
jgi:hypothetical protein